MLVQRPAYKDLILATAGLVAYWRLGETSGTVAKDELAKNHGTYGGGVTLGQAGALVEDGNAAAAFDGASGRVSVGAITTPATVEAWIKTAVGTERPVFSNRSGGQSVLYFGVNGGWIFCYATTRTPASVLGVTPVDDNRWHHIAYTWDGATGRLYRDGAVDKSVAQTDSQSLATLAASIGWDASNVTQYFNGRIDEVAIYNVALTHAQVAAHYHAGIRARLRIRTPYFDTVRVNA